MSFAFKKFSFFQQHDVKIHGFPPNSTCHCSGANLLYVGCDNGTIHLLDDTFQAQGCLNAFTYKVLYIAWSAAHQLLIAVGLEEPGILTATIKLWEAERVVAAVTKAAANASASQTLTGQTPAGPASVAGIPPLRLHRVFSNKYPESEVTALAIADSGATSLSIAVGLAAGSVYLFSGDISGSKGKLHHTGKLNARPDTGEFWKINALAYKQQETKPSTTSSRKDKTTAATASSSTASAATPAASGGKIAALSGRAGSSRAEAAAGSSSSEFVAEQWLFVVTESQTLVFNMADQAKTILDQQGLSSSACAVMKDGMLIVARDDGLYEYTTDTRAGCTAYEGIKQGLGLLKRCLYVVTDDTSPDGASSSILHLVDVKNKLVVGTFPLQGLSTVVSAPGGLATWCYGGKLCRYFEVELGTQLEVLFKRSLHKLALDLAVSHDADPELVAAIRQRWGDHLYAKAEYDGAMAQYLETIGYLEPSYVIRRFLDAQRIHSLTRYLEQLHDCGLGGADHTTLLLNCYTKLKDLKKLDKFIHRDDRGGSGEGGGSAVAANMAVLSAAANAARREHPKDEDTIPSFDMETAFKVLKSAGYAAHALSVAERAGQPDWVLDVLLEDMHSYPEAIAFIGMLTRPQQAQAIQRYGKNLISHAPDDTTALIMDLCMPPAPEESVRLTGDAAYTASVADFAHLYTDRPTRLLYLCEFILFNSGGEISNEQLLYHVLLELYLAEKLIDLEQEQGVNAAEIEPQARRDKARELLQRGWQPHMQQPKYDPEHALVLCRQHNYRPGLVLLYDKMRLHREVLAVYMEAQDYDGLIAACVQYGDAAAGGDPQLWAEALEYLCGEPGDCSSAISEVLRHIEAGALLPPLVVLQTLAKNKQLKVSLVKGYVARQLQAENVEISKDRETIQRLQQETAAMKAEANKLKTQPHVFQNSRCAATGQPLELPVVHFLCGHSFNLRSLGENDRECPLCTPDFKRVLDIRRNMKAGALKPDEFFTQLNASVDGFGVVAEHFGRGLMNMTTQSLASQNNAALGGGL